MEEKSKDSHLELSLLQQAERAKLWSLLKLYRTCHGEDVLNREATKIKKYTKESSLPEAVYIGEVKSSLGSILEDARKNPEKDYADHALALAKAFDLRD